jgi:hypothetical protein
MGKTEGQEGRIHHCPQTDDVCIGQTENLSRTETSLGCVA